MSGKCWGLDVIPEEKHIKLDKQYRTRDGKRVVLHEITLYNSALREVTYPVKGTIIHREKPLKQEYFIWSLDGRADVTFSGRENLDLVEI